MGILCFPFLYVIIGVVANDAIPPHNPPLSLEDTTATDESRILEQVKRLSQTFNDKMKTLNDRVDEIKRDISNILRNQKDTNFIPVYFMQPDTSNNLTFEVSRDWSNNHGFGDNWIVFQRRFNGSVNFYRNWTEYKQGFGDLRGEHWLGLDKLHAIVKTRQHELLIVLEDFEGVIAYAHYDDFKIGNESEKYVIESVGRYTGTAGDSFSRHKDEQFSTYDQDNDKHSLHCSQSFVGAWWFYKCHLSHLNGEYLKGKINRQVGIMWSTFRGTYYSLKSSKMMVRPVV